MGHTGKQDPLKKPFIILDLKYRNSPHLVQKSGAKDIFEDFSKKKTLYMLVYIETRASSLLKSFSLAKKENVF